MPLPPAVHTIGYPFIELQSVDSTNNYAFAGIHAHEAREGTTYFAHEQTAGKGQRGKIWATQKGVNLLMSIVLEPAFLQVFQQFQLVACTSLATIEFLRKYAPEGLKIKWPNDLYWNDRKIGGILIENIIGAETPGNTDLLAAAGAGESAASPKQATGQWKWAVVGMGININQTFFPDFLKNPVSLKQITGQTFDTIALAKELCQSLQAQYNSLSKDNYQHILNEYNENLFMQGEPVKFKKGNRSFTAIVKGVSETGQLILEHQIEERFYFGELEWIL